MRLSFFAGLSVVALLVIGSQGSAGESTQVATSTSTNAAAGAGVIRIRAQCKGQDEKVYGSPIVEVAENTPEAKLAAAEAACRPILEKAGIDWDNACADYVARLRPLNDEFMVLLNSGVPSYDSSFAVLKSKREDVYREFPECSSGRPVAMP